MTVERPLRLRYRMTLEDKARFLDACPHLLDDVQAIDKALGREPQNVTGMRRVEPHCRSSALSANHAGRRSEQKLFRRRLHARRIPKAEPITMGRDATTGMSRMPNCGISRTYRSRTTLKPTSQREVRPHVPDAWMERSKDKVGYEINFNRHFYKYTPPRPLKEIDAELKRAEAEIMRLLREVTE